MIWLLILVGFWVGGTLGFFLGVWMAGGAR